MAEGLRGPHGDFVCNDCGRQFCCATDQRPVPFAVCPNCGCRSNPWQAGVPVRGERVLISRWAYLGSSPQRWDVAAFRHPERARQIVIKRVVGLPGENIQIRQGDLYVDGQIVRKSLAQQRALAVPVYDSRYPPRLEPGLPSRWSRSTPDSGWQISPGLFRHSDRVQPVVEWCEYRHWQRSGAQSDAVVEVGVNDARGYNQGHTRRSYPAESVGDLLLSFRLAEARGTGKLLIRAGDGRGEFIWTLDWGTRRYEVSCRDKPPLACSGSLPDIRPNALVEVSLFDRQFLAAIDGHVLATIPFADAAPADGTSRPFALGAQNLTVVVCDAQILRDVYYTRPIGLDARRALDAPYRLGADEYFMLGDNSAASDDCRSWAHAGAVPAALLYGRGLMVYGPSCVWGVQGWRARLPDPRRMRYIR